jgi:hypothetical protein
MQAEAGITQLIYLVCVLDIVTDLVFNHPCRFDETADVELVSACWPKDEGTKGQYRSNEMFWFSPIARVSRAI